MMIANITSIWGVVLICSLVQFLFGVGLLLFGTPLLLLLDVPFRTALWLLLPASLTISSLQIVFGSTVDRGFVKTLGIYALPSLVLGVLVLVKGVRAPHIDFFVAVVLAASAAIRAVARVASAVRTFSARHEHAMLGVIGFVHGISNLGGGLLTAYAAARHVDKHGTRQTIALAYALFATTQLLVLALSGDVQLSGSTAIMACTAGVIFLTLGQMAFHRLSAPLFNSIFTVLILAMAALLFMKSAGVLVPRSR